MPNVTTYIRKGDMDKWLACPNKAELIHNALHSQTKRVEHLTKQLERVETKAVGDLVSAPKIIKTPQDAIKTIKEMPKLPNKNYCEHGQPKGSCLWKGCKFS